ncbi:MAG: DUF4416 family protein [Clostridia bacterium]|nr:DUF4416 family protein [Clostridia bacterium]
MGALHPFDREKMILGVLYHDPEVLEAGLSRMKELFGEFDDMTEEFSFSKEHSSYYDEELGGEAMRRIYSFKELVAPDRQAEIKTLTNAIEASLSVDGNRKINLDPGFMSIGRLMLPTTKDASFRIPLSDGIYTEITLFWSRGTWNKLPWTYQDYQSERVQTFLTRVHKTYLLQRKSEPDTHKKDPKKK